MWGIGLSGIDCQPWIYHFLNRTSYRSETRHVTVFLWLVLDSEHEKFNCPPTLSLLKIQCGDCLYFLPNLLIARLLYSYDSSNFYHYCNILQISCLKEDNVDVLLQFFGEMLTKHEIHVNG